MGLISDIAKNAGKLTQDVKKSYDAKILKVRIKNYLKEETELYAKLGKMLYQARSETLCCDGFKDIYDSIDAIKSRVKHLEQQLANVRLTAAQSEDALPRYIRLDRKESDLTIKRTDEGIRMIRLCPQCHTPNSPKDLECNQCKYIFEH